MSRIFLSHSSKDNDSAVALRDWLSAHGWDDVFLDLDPRRGISAGSRWQRSLNQAALRCEGVLFMVSRAWLGSDWCLKEFNLAHRLNKRLFGLLIEDVPIGDLPATLTENWQLVALSSGRDHVMLRAILPGSQNEAHVTFSQEGLTRLRIGLERAGLDARFFAWPPENDPKRPPYRGLLPLEADDAGIFFGREASTIEVLDRIRGIKDGSTPRFIVLLGASGAGKSSFLRAGLLPRLKRDDRNYLPLPVIRPEKAAINSETGLLRSLEAGFAAQDVAITRAEIRLAIEGGAATLRPLLRSLVARAQTALVANDADAKAPVLVLAIDQGEELFVTSGVSESVALLNLLRELLTDDDPALLVLVTIRSDAYEQLQTAKPLEGISQQPLSLIPMPRGAYQEVIEGPAAKLKGTDRPLVIEPALTQALLSDIENGGGRDALPLLAFTLERLYLEYGTRGRLTLQDYEALGRIKGSIEAAIERAFAAADNDARIPRDHDARLALLRRGLIPWLAGIDPDTGSPRRQKARISEIPEEARPLIDLLVEQRLLSTDVAEDTGERTIEPAHESLLRQWGSLQGWLREDFAALATLEAVKRSARDWSANGNSEDWLAHRAGRLEDAQRLLERADLAGNLDTINRAYLEACRQRGEKEKRDKTAALEEQLRLTRRFSIAAAFASIVMVGIIIGLVGWINQSYIKEQWRWYTVTRPYMISHVRPHVLNSVAEHELKPGNSFKECAGVCPEMVVVPAGSFTMGSPVTEQDHQSQEEPQHEVAILQPFAVSKYALTFAEWDVCAAYGECDPEIPDSGYGRGQQPVINVTWYHAQQYVAWLSKMTGKTYRLLTEAEYEYAARGGTQTVFPWGNEVGSNNANCVGCGSAWDRKQPAPVGSFPPNRFGLFDMVGNVFQWVADCVHPSYQGAPTNGSAWLEGGKCTQRVVRGDCWFYNPIYLRSASRVAIAADTREDGLGFRVARMLVP